MKLKYIVKENDTYTNINQVLKDYFKMSTRLISKIIKLEKVFLNDVCVDTRAFITQNDIISIHLDYSEDSSNVVPTKIDLDIIYEDEWMLIINKPSGIAIHPSNLHFDNSLSNGVKYYFNSIGLNKKIRPVNRLDSNTSGLVVFAKCEYIQDSLSKQMEINSFKKYYLALVSRKLDEKEGTIDLPIARKQNSIIERCIDYKTGQKSVTHYKVLQEFDEYSLVKCILETGRTHQIRLHMASIGHSLLADTLYGEESILINRQALHSYKIEFIHPVTNSPICFEIPLPSDMDNLII